MRISGHILRGLSGILLAVAGAAAPGGEPVRVASPFTDGMVIQCGRPAPVWGTAAPGTGVNVEFAGQSRSARAGTDGRWWALFDPMQPSGEPRELRITPNSGGEPIVVRDVVVGEVWLCAGQSNMRFRLRQATGAAQEIPRSRDPLLRWSDAEASLAGDRRVVPVGELERITDSNFFGDRRWMACTPETSPEFSAVAYFFGRRLTGELRRPVGLVHVAVGGAPIEAFVSPSTLAADPAFSGLLPDWLHAPAMPAWCRERAALNLDAWLRAPRGPAPHHPYEPGFIFRSGVFPLLPAVIRGVIWYQGESNATADGGPGPAVDPALNKAKLTALIRDWRREFADPELPFYFVQLPGLNRDWAPFRRMQFEVSREVPRCGMAVTLDVGHPTDVHPQDKRPVGDRLARQALRKTYGLDVAADGPVFRTASVRGGEVVVEFEDGVPPATRGGGPLSGFEVAGRDRAWRAAAARIEGRRVIAGSPDVPQPAFVRYAWGNDPKGNLVGADDLPASPFEGETGMARTKSVKE